jgi:SSS family solute:Na+ symporter
LTWHGRGALVPAAVMSIGAANLLARNFWKAYINPQVTDAGEAKVAKVTSLADKIGALLVIIFLPTQFALDLQLLGGIWILQTLPSLIFSLYTSWFRAPCLLAGWFVGFFGGTYLVWINGLKALQSVTVGETLFTIYIGLLALVVNIAVAIALNALTSSKVAVQA